MPEFYADGSKNSAGKNIQQYMTSYVGISGAAPIPKLFVETRFRQCCNCCTASKNYTGIISFGGMLVPNEAIKIAEVMDGTSNVLMVSETSDWAFTKAGGVMVRKHIDGAYPDGWTMGSDSGGTGTSWGKGRAFNITTIMYPPGTNNYDLPGIEDNHGSNNPLISAHPGGVVGLAVDGHVNFISNDIELVTLLRLATRDDRNSASFNSGSLQ